MSLEMNDLFRERFQGHESPVDPAAWDAIQSKLAMGAPVADPVNKLFQEKFQGHEAPVDPSVWSNISSQLGHPAATSISSVWGWAAAGVTALVIGGTALFLTNNTTVELAEVPQDSEEVRLPAVETTTIPSKIGASIANPEPTDQQGIVVKPVVPNSSTTASAAPLPSTVPKQATPDPVVIEPSNGFVQGAPETNEEKTGKTQAEDPKPVYGPIIVAQIIDELTTKAAEAAKGELENTKPEQSPSAATTDVMDEPSLNQPLTEEKPIIPLPELFIPNTFTPNGDNVNDTFEVIAEGYEKVMVRIFSVKENVQVFSTDNGSVWNGDNCSDGYYLVAVEAITKDGRSKTGSTMVWLNRNRLN